MENDNIFNETATSCSYILLTFNILLILKDKKNIRAVPTIHRHKTKKTAVEAIRFFSKKSLR